MAMTPGILLEMSGAYWQGCALHAAVKLGIFDVLPGAGKTAEQVAVALNTSVRGTAPLLNALAALGVLTHDGGVYRNTAEADRLLTKDSPETLRHILLHHHYLMDSWTRLDEAIRTGKPQRARAGQADDAARESFLKGMANLAAALAPEAARIADLSGCRSLLDLGGGPGSYAIAFCRAYPELAATVLDLPATAPVAQDAIDAARLADRIRFRAGDFTRDDPGGPYDAAWLSHILHGEGPETCRAVIAHAAAALNPGGKLFIQEFLLEDTLDRPLRPALFSLNMLVGTPEGRAYGEGEIRGMMAAAGLRNIRRLPYAPPNGAGILEGTSPRR